MACVLLVQLSQGPGSVHGKWPAAADAASRNPLFCPGWNHYNYLILLAERFSVFYSNFVRPVLFSIPPETVHRNTLRFAHWISGFEAAHRCLRSLYDVQFKELEVTAFGLHFRNPVGLAAGFDKHAEIHSLLPDLGFGHVEIGSVSLRPWPGNPSPTLLRLPQDHALINRLGLNSIGAELVSARLRSSATRLPVGVSLVKTADPKIAGEEAIEDFVANFAMFYGVADFITLNVSCPNSADGKTFEEPETLAPFLQRLRQKESEICVAGPRKPVLVKLSPDLDEATLSCILEITEREEISGYVIANTTTRRERLKTPASVLRNFGRGGLSGLPLIGYAQAMVDTVRKKVARKPIIAVGGIGCDPAKEPAETVWEYLKLGATLVQLHTGLIYNGPALVKRINAGLVRILNRNNFSSLGEFLQQQ